MKISNAIALVTFSITPMFTFANPDYGDYKGVGGMLAYDIKPNVYSYHYDKGFTGVDSATWDPNLQFAWSRIGAAKTCGIPFSEDKVIQQLVSHYGLSEGNHKIIGILFHTNHTKIAPNFCTDERVKELKAVLPNFESGQFPKKY